MTTVAQTTEIVKFNNQELLTLKVGEIIYTASRPIVEGMGLNWGSQSAKLKNPKFNCCDIETVAQDGKIRTMLCMPIKKLNGWLFSINPEKVKPEIKDDVIAYQEECFEALYNYWHKGEAVNPRFEKITDKQAYQLKTAVEKRCKNNKEHYQTLWTALKHRFEVPKYTDILVKDFDIAMNLVWTIALPSAHERLAHPLDAYALTNLKALVTHNFLMVSFYKTIEQPIKALNPSLWSHTFEHFWSAKSLAIGFNNQFDLGVDERYLLPYRC